MRRLMIKETLILGKYVYRIRKDGKILSWRRLKHGKKEKV
jgi:hypothetical protein